MTWKHIALALALLLAFIAGCAAASVSVPPATASTQARYEYFCLRSSGMSTEKIQADFNEAGAQGWELAIVNSSVNLYCFKRGG